MMFDIDNIPYDDQKTWDLLCSGETKGCFQMESKLVQHWVKAIKPRNLWELSAVIALVRPGPLKSGFADEYLSYRNGDKAFVSFGNEIIDSVFSSTENCLIYQESIMHLGSRLAWPHLNEIDRAIKVDALRKAVGKKNQKKLLEIGEEFSKGCALNGVSREITDKLFEIIKNCGRYLFNLSHSMSYAKVGYKTAYCKAHYPHEFFITYLTYAEHKLDKWQELRELYYDLDNFDLKLEKPNINQKNINFSYDGDTLHYGLSHLKHFGKTYSSYIKDLPEFTHWSQIIHLGFSKVYGIKLRSNCIEALICTGAFTDVNLSRNTLLNIVAFYNILTPKELEWFLAHTNQDTDIENLKDLVTQYGVENPKSKRLHILNDTITLTPLDVFDHPAWIENKETYYMGFPITATAVDTKQIFEDSCLSCKGNIPLWMRKNICVVINDIYTTKTKRGANPGQDMATISVHDSTGCLEKLPVFPEQYEKYQQLLIEKNTVALEIMMGRKGWVIQEVEQI